jgi:hypothetical protein
MLTDLAMFVNLHYPQVLPEVFAPGNMLDKVG